MNQQFQSRISHPSRLGVTSSVLIALVATGCSSERLSPEDFKRRERSEVIVSNDRPTNPQVATRPVQPTSPEDTFREAALQGNLSNVQKAIQAGVSVNSADPQGRTALQLAAFDGHTETVDYLISKKADINHRDQSGRTALMYASTGANVATVEALLNADAKIDLVDAEEHFTALMFAAAEGQNAVVKRLLNSGADITLADIDGDTAKSFAKKNGHQSVVDLLEETSR